jgi:hypothetical protein
MFLPLTIVLTADLRNALCARSAAWRPAEAHALQDEPLPRGQYRSRPGTDRPHLLPVGARRCRRDPAKRVPGSVRRQRRGRSSSALAGDRHGRDGHRAGARTAPPRRPPASSPWSPRRPPARPSGRGPAPATGPPGRRRRPRSSAGRDAPGRTAARYCAVRSRAAATAVCRWRDASAAAGPPGRSRAAWPVRRGPAPAPADRRRPRPLASEPPRPRQRPASRRSPAYLSWCRAALTAPENGAHHSSWASGIGIADGSPIGTPAGSASRTPALAGISGTGPRPPRNSRRMPGAGHVQQRRRHGERAREPSRTLPGAAHPPRIRALIGRFARRPPRPAAPLAGRSRSRRRRPCRWPRSCRRAAPARPWPPDSPHHAAPRRHGPPGREDSPRPLGRLPAATRRRRQSGTS